MAAEDGSRWLRFELIAVGVEDSYFGRARFRAIDKFLIIAWAAKRIERFKAIRIVLQVWGSGRNKQNLLFDVQIGTGFFCFIQSPGSSQNGANSGRKVGTG